MPHAGVFSFQRKKAVDVMLSVDLVLMGHRNEYDAAYLLSAYGDYTPAVEAVRIIGKRGKAWDAQRKTKRENHSAELTAYQAASC
jgi:uncharacterized LabA/DUF88 family protein